MEIEKRLRHGSLFSGIGGFDLAAEWMGWNNVFHCEWNDFGKQVLKYYWPNAISYDDITKTDFTIHRGTIDILTGGFPCQPYSAAGKRKGKEDERHLWPEMLRAIREIQPTWVVGENVSGLVNWNDGLVFDEVQAEMEIESYEVIPFLLPACGINAPHKRERVWFVAYSDLYANRNIRKQDRKTDSLQGINREEICATNTGNNTNANNTGLQGSQKQGSINKSRTNGNKQFTRLFQPNWEKFPTQSPVCGRDDGLSDRLVGIAFPKWRTESIKAYGNAIVPQVAYEIFKAIGRCEEVAR